MGTVAISNNMTDMLSEISPKSKVAQLLLSGASNNKEGSYLDYAQGNISFLPHSAGTVDGVYTHRARQSGKCARTARRFIRPDFLEFEIEDTDLEVFANAMKAADITEMVEMRLVEGEDIRKYYSHRQYANRNTGSLGQSCMRYDECQPFFDLYVNNPNQIKMVIAVHKETHKLVGRALIWYTKEGDVVMDRIYGNDSMIVFFRNYAKSQGWYTRAVNSIQNERTWNTPNGEEVTKTWKIELDNPKVKQYPYMDTFKYYNRTEGWISNGHRDGHTHLLQHTHGGTA